MVLTIAEKQIITQKYTEGHFGWTFIQMNTQPSY